MNTKKQNSELPKGERPVAIVTGASRGIGKAISIELAGIGFDIVINHYDFATDGSPDETAAQKTSSDIAAKGIRCLVLRADVSNDADRTGLIKAVKDEFGRCDMLINNAGVAPLKRVDLLEATEESFDRVLGINLKGP